MEYLPETPIGTFSLGGVRNKNNEKTSMATLDFLKKLTQHPE